jgi:hypothetical protein
MMKIERRDPDEGQEECILTEEAREAALAFMVI